MRARHRLSKMLLRQGLVYDASAWTIAHDAWLRRQRFESRPLALAFDECYGAVLQAERVRECVDRLRGEFDLGALSDETWRDAKLYYIGLLVEHSQPELAETFFNSVITRILQRTYYENDLIFVRAACPHRCPHGHVSSQATLNDEVSLTRETLDRRAVPACIGRRSVALRCPHRAKEIP